MKLILCLAVMAFGILLIGAGAHNSGMLEGRRHRPDPHDTGMIIAGMVFDILAVVGAWW